MVLRVDNQTSGPVTACHDSDVPAPDLQDEGLSRLRIDVLGATKSREAPTHTKHIRSLK